MPTQFSIYSQLGRQRRVNLLAENIHKQSDRDGLGASQSAQGTHDINIARIVIRTSARPAASVNLANSGFPMATTCWKGVRCEKMEGEYKLGGSGSRRIACTH